MKRITKILVLLSVWCISHSLKAHQPDLSSIILAEQGENNWVLQIRSALTAFEYVVEEHYGKSSYATPEEFQELVVEYIRHNITIQFNEGSTAILQKGMVKLGHETNVVFQLGGIPEIIHSLVIENKSFQHIPRSKSALIVYKEGYSKDQFTLKQENGHSIKLKMGISKFEPVESGNSWRPIHFLLLTIGLLAIPMAVFTLQKRRANGWDSILSKQG